ncbi:MAG: hypothetical protein M3Z08_23835 [Chloroflexota bacterium]|nr:hypothetical protein [Chloroflexota bacterium]
MAFQICIKTDKSLRQLASEICSLFSLPPYKENTFAGASYYQFEMLGMLVLLHHTDEEDRDPEVLHYPYSFDLQLSFLEHKLDTDDIEYRLQPYYTQLLSFHLGLDTTYHEKQKVGRGWQIRYHFYQKNPRWDGSALFGEPGWEPGVIEATPSEWRSMHPVF